MYDFNLEFKPDKKTIELLKRMGYKKACAFSESNSDFFIKGTTGSKGDFTVLDSSDPKKLMHAAKNASVDAFTNVESSSRGDYLNQRFSGLNKGIAKLMAKNKISLLLSFHKSKNHKILGRMRQNIRLCLKYGVPTIMGSGAMSNDQIVHPESLIGLCQLLGMDRKQAKQTVTYYPEKILRRNKLRKDPKFVMPGVRII